MIGTKWSYRRTVLIHLLTALARPDAPERITIRRRRPNPRKRRREFERRRRNDPTSAPGQEHSEEVAPTVAPAPSTEVPVPTSAPPSFAVPSRSAARADDVPRLPLIPEEVPEQQVCHHVQCSENSFRDAEATRGYDRGHDEGHPAPECGSAPLVLGGTIDGRKQGAAPCDVVARAAVTRQLSRAALVYDPVRAVADRVCVEYSPGLQSCETEGKLDPVSPGLAGRIDLRRLAIPNVNCPVGRASSLLFDYQAMRGFMLPVIPPLQFHSTASVYRRFASELLDSHLCTKSREACGFARFFTVVKKISEGVPILRTILDCKTANESFAVPDPVNLPALPDMLAALRYVECIRSLDLRHMYHQILIGDHLRPYFCVAMGSLRLTWRVLAMGWSWACFIAQSISTFAVAGADAFDWSEIPRCIHRGKCVFFVVYDNIIGGGPADELERYWTEIRGRLTNSNGLNAIIKEDLLACAGSAVDVLGISWRPDPLRGLTWRLLDKFVLKLSAAASLFIEERTSAKTIARCLGLVAWGRYATRGHLFDMARAYSRLADAVARGGWHASVNLVDFLEVSRALQSLQTSGLQGFTDISEEVLIFSDAHVSGYGWVGGAPLVSQAGKWSTPYESKDMFFLESIAAKLAVVAFASSGRLIHLALDNMALVLAIRKRSTTCPRTAYVLEQLFSSLEHEGSNITANWIPTAFNPADELSRGLAFDLEKMSSAPSKVVWTVPPVPQWGSELGRVVGPTRV
eukprot:PhM_4_TR2388/c2_g1_i3/m.10369